MASSASPRDGEGLVGFLGGRVFVVVFERQKGELLVRLVELGIELGGFLRRFDRVLAEAFASLLARDPGRPGRCSCRSSSASSNRPCGFFGIEALEKQVAPADAVVGVLGKLLDQVAKLIVGFLVAFDAPEAFGAKIGIGAGGELGVSRSALRRACHDGEASGMIEWLRGVCAASSGKRRAARTAPRSSHLSSSACVLASSSNSCLRAASCTRRRHGGLFVFQFVDLLFQLVALFEQRFLFGRVGGHLGRADSQQRETAPPSDLRHSRATACARHRLARCLRASDARWPGAFAFRRTARFCVSRR